MISTLAVSLVPQSEVHRVWDQVAPMLKRATDISEGRYDLDDLKDKLFNDPDWNLWIVFEEGLRIVAAITSTWTHYPQGLALHGQFLGGSRLDEWQDQFCDIFDNWGRDAGAKFIEFTGRKGWAKPLARNGYRPIYVIYQRDL